MPEKHEEIQKFLATIPQDFSILEEGIDTETQKEYLDLSVAFGPSELSDEDLKMISTVLNSKKAPLELRKKALLALAHAGSIQAFRELEKFYTVAGKELKQWTALALQECRMFLESFLTDRNFGFITSGLGGVKDKLRIYFLFLSKTKKPFSATQKKIIKDEFELSCGKLKCVIESVDPGENFVAMKILVPMDVAIGTVADSGIVNCNELGDFVLEHYYATNQKIPVGEEIEDIIKIVRGEKEPPKEWK